MIGNIIEINENTVIVDIKSNVLNVENIINSYVLISGKKALCWRNY